MQVQSLLEGALWQSFSPSRCTYQRNISSQTDFYVPWLVGVCPTSPSQQKSSGSRTGQSCQPSWGSFKTFQTSISSIFIIDSLAGLPFNFKYSVLLLFFHNSYGTPEFPYCGNLVEADWVGNLRRDHTELYVQFSWVHTEALMYFRKGNMNPSMHLRMPLHNRPCS